MCFGQADVVKQVFQETATTWGLAIGILIVLVLVLAFVIWLIVRQGVRWIKPLIEEFFNAHLLTMKVVREEVVSQAKAAASQADSMQKMAVAQSMQVEQQKVVAKNLVDSNTIQTAKLEEIKKATDTTNKILSENGKCQVNQIDQLIRELHPKGAR